MQSVVMTPQEMGNFEDLILITAVKQLAFTCHDNSLKAGWWTQYGFDLAEIIRSPKTPFEEILSKALVGQKLCLTHSELSEGMEGYRQNLMDDKLPHRPMLEVELADAIARIFDLGGALKLDVAGALIEKLEFNKTRPDHKPENRAKEGGKSF